MDTVKVPQSLNVSMFIFSKLQVSAAGLFHLVPSFIALLSWLFLSDI